LEVSRKSSREHLDLAASRVLAEDERPIAIILMARQGWAARIAAMGVTPEYLQALVVARHARDCGLGRHMITVPAAV
jgi:hypothetical protein